MTNKEIDRRVARTRNALHQALISLILRKGYDATTIQDIIDKADVGRSTFYAHYTGKDDLLHGGFERLRTELAEARRSASARPEAGPLAFSATLFDHAWGYKEVYRALIGGRGGTLAMDDIRDVLSSFVREELSGAWEDGEVSRDLAVQFVVSTFLTVLTSLLAKRSKLTPAAANVVFRRLVLGGVGSSIRRDAKTE
jgi:AcrR family transcriptional regulator